MHEKIVLKYLRIGCFLFLFLLSGIIREFRETQLKKKEQKPTQEKVKKNEYLVKDEIPGHITLYAGLNEVRFKNSVRPGDTCEVTARIDERKGQLFFCTAKLEVNGKLCCKGKPIFSLVPIENGK